MKSSSAILLVLVSVSSFAQSPVSARLNAGVDIGAGFKSQQLAPSIAYYQLLNLGEKKLLAVGYTATFGTFYAQNLSYTTAPARADSDTVFFANASMTSVNLGLRAEVNLGPVTFGATADVLGVGFGRNRTGQYQSSAGKFVIPSAAGKDSVLTFTGTNANQSASPTNINLRLLGSNNIGTLSSEVYARLKIDQRIGLKVGYQWLTTEMRVKNRDVITDNNRFRNRTSYPYVAVTFFVF